MFVTRSSSASEGLTAAVDRAMDAATALLLAGHLAATASMAGIIWFVQIVHYPRYPLVGDDRFVAYEARHTRRTAFVVGPPMAIEGALALVHLSTVCLQVPAHRRLSVSADAAMLRRLVRTNRIRTAGWSLRGAVAVTMITVAA